jgi:transposase-like protein
MPEKSNRVIAEMLGINEKTLAGWVLAARNAQIDPNGSMSDAARRRIRELEAENARLRKDLDFERKAQAFVRTISLRRNGSR